MPLAASMGFRYSPTEGEGAAVLRNLQPLGPSLSEAKELEAIQSGSVYSVSKDDTLKGVRKYIYGLGYVYLIGSEKFLLGITLKTDNTFEVTPIETFGSPQRISLLPIFSTSNDIFSVLVCRNSGTSGENKIYYFSDGTWFTGNPPVPKTLPISLPRPTQPYILMASLSKHEPVEYRYTITYSNDYVESPPSLINRFLGHRVPIDTPLGKIGIYSAENINQSGLMVNIYRWTSVINAWIKLQTFPYEDNWYVYDDKPADYLGEFATPPFGQDTAVATDPVEDACSFAGRIYLAVRDVLKVSRINRFVFTPEVIEEEDVAYVRFPFRVTNLFVWGNHILVLTDSGWFRVVENEGFLVVLPVDFPLPANRDWVKETDLGIVIAQTDCVYLLDRNENIVRVGNVDWERVFRADRGVGREPLKITTYERSGKRYLNIVYPVFREKNYSVLNNDLGFECIRIDMEEQNVFLDTRVIPVLEVI